MESCSKLKEMEKYIKQQVNCRTRVGENYVMFYTIPHGIGGGVWQVGRNGSEISLDDMKKKFHEIVERMSEVL